MNRSLLFALVATIGASALAGCSKDRSADRAPATERGVPVATSVVRFASVPVLVSAVGRVIGGANSRAALAFPESGRIAHVDVTVGERVMAGQRIASLDPGLFAADAAQMRAALAAARANDVRTASGARPQLVAETSALIRGDDARLAVARNNLARAQQLLGLGIASRVDVETAEAAVASGDAQLQVDRQQRSAQVRPYAPDVAAALAGVAQAQAALDEAQLKIDDATLRAPFAGVVVARLHDDGESVDPTMPIVQIANASNAVFTAEFAPQDAQQIHRGDRATVEAQGTTEISSGNVIAIDPQQTSAARTVPVLIRLVHGGLAFGPGADGTAAIAIGSKRGLTVPSAAIVSDPTTGTMHVFRKVRDTYEPVSIEIVRQFGTQTSVRDTRLRAGDTIVTSGAYELERPSQSAPMDADGK